MSNFFSAVLPPSYLWYWLQLSFVRSHGYVMPKTPKEDLTFNLSNSALSRSASAAFSSSSFTLGCKCAQSMVLASNSRLRLDLMDTSWWHTSVEDLTFNLSSSALSRSASAAFSNSSSTLACSCARSIVLTSNSRRRDSISRTPDAKDAWWTYKTAYKEEDQHTKSLFEKVETQRCLSVLWRNSLKELGILGNI